ncbi:hypothetical protein BCR34DRAFT_528178 [Clohesyomyces aquaticus]|uniref:Methyltransferase domain-containing protein n=1 Tax=Clohesyomyces aquaticus TaxID=1231657 RepID=A0A1Y2A9V6_9PLEO|nr:hypothetical protein BCR34DRAFT_528178 [Clohesyomyces aquaticus]
MDLTAEIITLPNDHPARSKALPWYNSSISGALRPSMSFLPENWSKIRAGEVEAHIHNVASWKVLPRPSIGKFRFLEQVLLRHPSYEQVLTALTTRSTPPPRFLDIGACLDQDLRMLASAGVPTDQLSGTDIFPKFERIGHMVFRDEDQFSSTQFICGNSLSHDAQDSLRDTRGPWSIVHLSMFLHIFDLDDQERVCMRVMDLL